MLIASWPRPGINPYCELYYNALGRFGVEVEYLDDVAGALAGPEIDYDAVHFHWNIEGIWRAFGRGSIRQLRGLVTWARLLRRLKRAGIPIIWTAHELSPPEDGTWIDRLGYQLCARSADLTICHSEVCRGDVLRQFRVAPERVVAIPLGAYDGVLTPTRPSGETRARRGLPASARLLLCFGYQRPRKGLEVALGAMSRLGPEYHLAIHCSTRGGARRKWLRGLREAHASATNITFLHEELDGHELGDLLHAADCIVLPYLEIVGSAALAACHTVERGVVVSDLPYFRESLATEPDAGVFFTPGDSADLARAVEDFFAIDRAPREAAMRRLAHERRWDHVVTPIGEWLQARLTRRAAVDRAVLQTGRG